ncbi:MAG: hypothetical protein M3Z03_04345 [Actinomycetota bacterium]|nr:hypothetical protein [Actinomycetota bacterium]
MDSLTRSGADANAFFVCDHADLEEQAAAAAAGASVLLNPSPRTTFAVKVNHGYRSTIEPWILVVGDDVRFTPGWFDAALVAAGEQYHLVGTNDLSGLDRRVLAVHPLVRRSWVDEHGASWDGPGTLAHEGYRHCFVDNEWTAVAHQAGVLTFAADAVIEHLHPEFGKAAVDEVYARGRRSYERDERLWLQRAAEFAG